MQRRLVHAGAWLCATSVAAALSWFGVHTVISGTAYDPPRAVTLSLDGDAETAEQSSTRRPKPADSPSPSASGASPSPSPSDSASPSAAGSPSARPSRTPSGSASPPAPGKGEQPPTGQVRSYTADGGLVAFDLRADSAALVSATPGSGWQVEVWQQEFWIRVTFSKGDRASSIFCTWHDGPPRVQLDER
ncbi:hypothetical protein QNO07_09805 [Streptomyces sp. 549]|uniref:hypothetical protein n=1 Tax=Streptomyces sp. 549 TaxID=3049076 RepID=UPI0024C372FB|nr:hypothetical protein [Streptomyces sp. 549]MDK1473714.1 hypothetical protein [Streptomyces sp. 549]